jgi:hypothetical protein
LVSRFFTLVKFLCGVGGSVAVTASSTLRPDTLTGAEPTYAFNARASVNRGFRKTAASVLDDAGLPIGDVADQLGNTRTVAERHHVRRKVANIRTAAALEGMLDSES